LVLMAVNDDELRKIFRQFDSDGSGSIDHNELNDAMRMLGVKCTPNSAKKVLASIDKDGNGTVEWDEFHSFFSRVSDPAELKSLLSEANQRFLDYKQMVEEDANFGKRFFMPKMVEKRQTFVNHNDNVESVVWLTDDTFMSCSIDGEMMIWDATDSSKRPRPKRVIEAGVSLYCMAMTPDRKRILTGTSTVTDNLLLWQIDDDKPSSRYVGHSTPVYCCGSSPDGAYLLSGGKTGKVCYHDLNVPAALCEFQGHEGVVYSQDFMRDGLLACTASSDGQVRIWDARNPRGLAGKGIIEDAAASGTVYQALFRGDKEIVSCGDDYCIKRFDIRKPNAGPVASFFGHTSVVKSIALSPDDKFLVSATDDGSLRVWLADELGLLEERASDTSRALHRLETDIESMQEKIGEGEADPSDLKPLVSQFKEKQSDARYLAAVKKERVGMSCIQARVCLEGHKLPAVACAWRTINGEDKARIVSGSQDQTIRLFEVDTKAIGDFELWSKDSLPAG